MKIYKHFIKMRNQAWKLRGTLHGNGGSSRSKPPWPARSTKDGRARFAAYMLLGVAPVFSAVAPPMRAKARTAATASANDALSTADRIAALEQKVADAQSAGDNAWMLVSSALGAADDRAGAGALLRRAGAEKERARDHDAELFA